MNQQVDSLLCNFCRSSDINVCFDICTFQLMFSLYVSTEDHREPRGQQQQQKKRDAKRPNVNIYQPMAGEVNRRQDSEGENTPPSRCKDPNALACDSHENVTSPHSDNKIAMEKFSAGHKRTNGEKGNTRADGHRPRGSGRNSQNGRKAAVIGNTCPQSTKEDGQGNNCGEMQQEHHETTGASNLSRKARKPDQQFYQPGSRRSTQSKDGMEPEADGEPAARPPPERTEPRAESPPQNHTEAGGGGGVGKYTVAHNEGGKEPENQGKDVKPSNEQNRKKGRREAERPPSAAVLGAEPGPETLAGRVAKLSLKEQEEGGGGGGGAAAMKEDGETGRQRAKASQESQKAHHGEPVKGDGENPEKKRERGNRRRRGGDREKDGNPESGRGRVGESGAGGGGGRGRGREGKSDPGPAEAARRVSDGNRGQEASKSGETRPPAKGRENNRNRDNRRGSDKNDDDDNNNSRSNSRAQDREQGADAGVSERNKPHAAKSSLSSKRYSKSDIRRTRNRTYSSSSASSAASFDTPSGGMAGQRMQWSRSGLGRTATADRDRLSWASNGRSSTESPEGSDAEDRQGGGRRRDAGEKERSGERRREEESRSQRPQREAERGILRVSLEPRSAPPPTSTADSRQGSAPRGKGRGILVLPAHTDLSRALPEQGPRLLFGGPRGAATSRGRGGRGGSVRRLWDPNNPDQKPALSRPQLPQHSPLLQQQQQPMYLQTGGGYGQLHFLDTDDEVAGSPPVYQGEGFQSQQAAAMAYYKFQNSDNPYGYTMPSGGSPHNPGAGGPQRYPYPYHMSPSYHMGPANGMYPASGAGHSPRGYRAVGYAQQGGGGGGGGGGTPEEVAQQNRVELARMLRAADTQELQLNNLLSRDNLSADGLDRMAQLR